MASTYTDLGLELMATGENAGTWGTKTNTNLSLIEQLTGGYTIQTLNAGGTGANTTPLEIDDGALTGAAQNRVIILGAVSAETITGNKIVTVPLLAETFYIIKNSTSGAYTVQLKAVSGSGATVTWGATEKDYKIVYFDGVATNTGCYDTGLGAATSAAGSNTQVQYNSAGAFAGSANLIFDGTDTTMASAKVTDLTATRVTIAGTSGALEDDADLVWTAGTGLIINSEKELRLSDADDSAYVGLKSAATVSSSYTLTLPAATGTADQILVTDGSGNLSFVDNSGGTAWVAVKTSGFTAIAGEGYFCDTTSAAFTLTLPAGTLGDEISFIDYAGTFDTNTLTVAPDGSEKIQGVAASLTVSVERAANTLVYTDGTQGWLLKAK